MGSYNFPSELRIRANLKIPSSISRQSPDGNGQQLTDEETRQQEWIQEYGIAGRTWEAAAYLCDYLIPAHLQRQYTFDPPCSLFPSGNAGTLASAGPKQAVTILELGSGNGHLGIHHLAPLLDCDASLILTDLPEVVPLLESSLSSACSDTSDATFLRHRVSVRPLAWGSKENATQTLLEIEHERGRRITHILCSDLVYFPELLEPLLKTLVWLTEGDVDRAETERAEVIIGYKVRSLTKETPFWESFGAFFELWPVIRRGRRRKSPEEDAAASFDAFEDAPHHLQLQDSEDDEAGSGTSSNCDGEAEEDLIFVFLARRKTGTRTRMANETEDLSDVMKGKDGQFEEFLMLRSLYSGSWD